MGEILKNPCSFCSTKKSPSHLTEYGLPPLDLIPLFETEKISVFTDKLPAHPQGIHLLLVPKQHRQACAQLGELRDEIGYMIARVEEEFNMPVIKGEHGGGDPSLKYGESKIQSVYHPHMHLFGNERGIDVLQYMQDVLKQKEHIPFQLLRGLDGTPVPFLQARYTGHPYLFIQQGSRGIWSEDPGDTFPSQILQRNMSTLYNGEPLNWKQIPHKPQFARLSAQRIVNVFNMCKI